MTHERTPGGMDRLMRVRGDAEARGGIGGSGEPASGDPELRALGFQWLALCFSYPTEETGRVQKALVQQVGDLLLFSQDGAAESSESPERVPHPHASGRGVPVTVESLEDRQMAYLRLIKRVTPCETEYTRTRTLLPTDNIADVAGFYRAFGFEVKAGSERADHIAAELQFMALLAMKEAAARDAGEEQKATICADAQKKFLADHLGPFVVALEERLTEYVRVHADSQVWLEAARAARSLAEEIAAAWRVTITPPAEERAGIISRIAQGVDAEALECPFAEPEPDDRED